MTATFLSLHLLTSARLLPAPVVSTGIGPVLALLHQPSLGGAYLDTFGSLLDAKAIDDAEDDGDLTAQQAIDLKAMLSQDVSGPGVYVYAYDGDATTVGDELTAMDDAAAEAGIRSGTLYIGSRDDAHIAAAGVWHGTGGRWQRRVLFAQTNNSDIATAGKPAAFTAAEVESFSISAHSSTAAPLAASFAGVVGGYDMLNNDPLGATGRVRGVDLPTYTTAQIQSIVLNDAHTLVRKDRGASALERRRVGTTFYGGFGAKPVLSFVYTIRTIEQAISDFWFRLAITQAALPATVKGANAVRAIVAQALGTIEHHFTPGLSGEPPNEVLFPEGWQVDVVVVGDSLRVTVKVRIGREVRTIILDVTGEEI